MVKVTIKGAVGQAMLREFYCAPCDARFETFSKRDASGEFEKRTHSCGALCSPASVPRPGTRMAIRSREVAPRDIRKVFQRQFGLNDNQMSKLTRDDIDRAMKRRGLEFVDAAYDEAKNGGKRERGEAVELPPETDDPNKVREWNEKKYGHRFVQDQQQASRAAFEAMQRGDAPPPLPEAKEVDVHDTPHVVDVERAAQVIREAPTVAPERRRELQGKVVTGR